MSRKSIGLWTTLLVLALAAGAAFVYLRRAPTPAAGPEAAAASQAQDGASRPGNGGATAGAGGGGGGPIAVTTVLAATRDFKVKLDANGTVVSLNSVDIRPQVSTVITKVHIREGQFVKAGDILFSLDNRTDQVAVTRAQADLQKAQAALADAQRNLARSQDLQRQQFVSQSAVDTNQAAVDAQNATVAASRAAVDAAKVGLGYSRIVAPSAGRVGAINVFAGSFVAPSTTVLANITQLDPIGVSFSLPQRNLNDALDTLRSGGGVVTAQLPENRGALNGKLQFVDSSVDASSGAVKVKAVFPNPDEKLWPGAYVNVSLQIETIKNAITVPQASIIQGARGKAVYVIEGGKAALQPVEVVYAAGNDAVVKGVAAGARVVVDGRQNLRPGATVIDTPLERAGTGNAARAMRAASAASGPAPQP